MRWPSGQQSGFRVGGALGTLVAKSRFFFFNRQTPVRFAKKETVFFSFFRPAWKNQMGFAKNFCIFLPKRQSDGACGCFCWVLLKGLFGDDFDELHLEKNKKGSPFLG